MRFTTQQLAEALGARLCGDGAAHIGGIASLGSAKSTDLSFVEDEQHLAPALASSAGALIAGEFAAHATSSKPLLISSYPRLAFARAAALIHPSPPAASVVHPTAVVHASARLGEGVSIGAHAVISEDVVIGGHTRIGPGASLAPGVVLGEYCMIEANASIYSGTRIGARVVVHAGAVLGSDGFGYVRDPATGRYEKFPQVGTLIIHDDVEIGANTTVDRGALDSTIIGRGTKLDNLVHIGHNVHLGQNVVIAAQTGISGSSVIEDNVMMGGQVGIGDHARVKEGAILGGQCGVLNGKVLRGKGTLFWGTPARPVREYLKQAGALARLARKRD
jgi:UDP-3-O-[3-hydroxymyristoyl] glucosamine N-acyltransferase